MTIIFCKLLDYTSSRLVDKAAASSRQWSSLSSAAATAFSKCWKKELERERERERWVN